MKRPAPGFTLLELITAAGIMSVVMLAVAALVSASARFVTHAQQQADTGDAARQSEELILRELRLAGFGSPQGIWVVPGGQTTPIQINPVFSQDAFSATDAGTAPDDLWVVIPTHNVSQVPCTPGTTCPSNPHGAPTVIASTTGGGCSGGLTVVNNGEFNVGDLALVTNYGSAALLSGVNPTGTPCLGYNESSSSLSDAPNQGGFHRGDLVFVAQVDHFYIAPDPVTGRPSLFRARGQLQNDSLGRPFSDVPGSALLVQRGVEDLQLAFGFDPSGAGDPSSYTYQNGLGHLFHAGLVSVRVSTVTVSDHAVLDPLGHPLLTRDYAPLPVENDLSTATPPPDGFRRNLYRRRLELLNMETASL